MIRENQKKVLSEFFLKLFDKETIPAEEKKRTDNFTAEKLNEMDSIKKLTNQYDWYIGACDYRYGGGIFVFMAPSEKYIQRFSELFTSKKKGVAIDFYSYVRGKGNWLPIVYASSLEIALQVLNEKLNRPTSPEWRNRVEKSYAGIGE